MKRQIFWFLVVLVAGIAAVAVFQDRARLSEPKVKIVDWDHGMPVVECNGPGEAKCADCSDPNFSCFDLKPDHDPVGTLPALSFEDKKRMYRQDLERTLREHPELGEGQQAQLRALLEGLQDPRDELPR